MSLATLRDDLVALEAAVAAVNVPDILHTAGDVLKDAGDVAALFLGTPVMHAAAKADPVAQECSDCCDRIKAACAAPKAPVAKAGPGSPVGALWDGTLLTIFLQNLPALLDWIKKLISG